MARVWRGLLGGASRLRGIGERGEVRHLLLFLLVLGFVVVLLGWQGRVNCLYRSVETAVTTPGGAPGLDC